MQLFHTYLDEVNVMNVIEHCVPVCSYVSPSKSTKRISIKLGIWGCTLGFIGCISIYPNILTSLHGDKIVRRIVIRKMNSNERQVCNISRNAELIKMYNCCLKHFLKWWLLKTVQYRIIPDPKQWGI